jgi:hypothetical protein
MVKVLETIKVKFFKGVNMTEQQFEDAMNTYELEDRYAEFIENNHNVGNNHVLIRLMERGDYYEAFKESMVTQ